MLEDQAIAAVQMIVKGRTGVRLVTSVMWLYSQLHRAKGLHQLVECDMTTSCLQAFDFI